MASLARARQNADLDKLLQSGRPIESADPLDATLAASQALLSVTTRSVVDVLEIMTLGQFTTLAALAAEPLTLSQLARQSDAAPKLVDDLIEAGWVSEAARQPHQGPDACYELTPHGAQLIAQVGARQRSDLATVLSAIPDGDQRAVAAAFSAFADAVDDLRAEA